MKKTKIVGCLSSAFVALVALASCQGVVKANGDVVLTYNGVTYTADDLFKDQKSASASEAKFNAVLKVAVRQWANGDEGSKYKTEIENNTKIKISGQKAVAQSNADKNGTSYDTEWNKILSSNSVESESELYDKFEYDYQKEKFDEVFNDEKFETLKKGGCLIEGDESTRVDGYIPKKAPYHVKHILVKVGAADKDYIHGEITEDNAVKLSRVIKRLASGENFATVAKDESDDTGSAAKGGDLGIMDLDTSFVNEFKLGTYLFESFFSKNGTLSSGAETTKYDLSSAKIGLFGENGKEGDAYKYAQAVASKSSELSNVSDPTTDSGIGVIPFEAGLMLGKDEYEISTSNNPKKGVAEVTYEKAGLKNIGITDDKAMFYPRNVIFNKYFNKHNLMFITKRSVDRTNAADIIGDSTTTAINKKIYTLKNGGSAIKVNDTYNAGNATFDDKYTSFKKVFKNNDSIISSEFTNEEILCDNNNRPILVFRAGTSGDSSYQGIHFVVIERSPFVGNEYEMKYNETEKKYEERNEPVALNEYYTKYYPGQSSTEGEHPHYDDKTEKTTYVTYLQGELKDYKDRADTVKTKVQSSDSNLNTYIYKYLLKTGNLKFNGDLGAQIENDINTWIERKIEDTDYSTKKTWNETWKTYYFNLDEQTRVRKKVEGESVVPEATITGLESFPAIINGIVSEYCSIAYMDWYEHKGASSTNISAENMKKLFNAGGAFHE